MPQPCNECPFRRKSLQGYIGGHKDPSEITDIVVQDGKFPCHMATQEFQDDGFVFEVAANVAPVCVGSAIFLNNQLKLSRHPDVAKMQKRVEKSDDVFGSLQAHNGADFCDYHRGRMKGRVR